MSVCERCTENHNCAWQNHEETICHERPAFPLTNADRIRSMSDEELADFMAEIMYCVKCWKFDKEQGICTRASGCNSAMLEWLKQEGE